MEQITILTPKNRFYSPAPLNRQARRKGIIFYPQTYEFTRQPLNGKPVNVQCNKSQLLARKYDSTRLSKRTDRRAEKEIFLSQTYESTRQLQRGDRWTGGQCHKSQLLPQNSILLAWQKHKNLSNSKCITLLQEQTKYCIGLQMLHIAHTTL